MSRAIIDGATVEVTVVPPDQLFVARLHPEVRRARARLIVDDAEKAQAMILRHVDDIAQTHIRYDRICIDCGSRWTEKSDTYNGGCCDEDEKHNPEGAQ